MARACSLWRDTHYALRGMRKNPGFSVVAALTLSLGIGLCSMLFSILNGVILRPVPGVPDPGRLAAVRESATYPYFESYRDQPGLAAGTAAFIAPVPFGVALEGPGAQRPERLFGHLVSLEYLSTLGVEPTMGRFFDPDQEKNRQALRLMSASSVMPIPGEQRAAVMATYVVLMGLILALTSASLAGLILARGSARRKEIAIRLSLGAGRFRLIRQLLTESFVLAALGGAVGLAMAYGLIEFSKHRRLPQRL